MNSLYYLILVAIPLHLRYNIYRGVLMKNLLTAKELSKRLSLSVATIWRYTREGRIPVVEFGSRQYRYDEDQVLVSLAKDVMLVKEERASKHPDGYTYEDYLQIPEDPSYHCEVLEGVLVKEPSPAVAHQRVSRELLYQLKTFFDDFDPGGELFCAPLDVTLTQRNVLQPDLLFVSSKQRNIIQPERISGPCELIVEITSPGNRRKDRLQKMDIYRKAGIRHFWLADPEECTLEAFQLKDVDYFLVATGGSRDTFTHPSFTGLSLDLHKVFG